MTQREAEDILDDVLMEGVVHSPRGWATSQTGREDILDRLARYRVVDLGSLLPPEPDSDTPGRWCCTSPALAPASR